MSKRLYSPPKITHFFLITTLMLGGGISNAYTTNYLINACANIDPSGIIPAPTGLSAKAYSYIGGGTNAEWSSTVPVNISSTSSTPSCTSTPYVLKVTDNRTMPPAGDKISLFVIMEYPGIAGCKNAKSVRFLLVNANKMEANYAPQHNESSEQTGQKLFILKNTGKNCQILTNDIKN